MLISDPIILAGGYGKRLRSVVKDIPKVMAEINGKPFLELILDQLNQEGFQKAVLLIGYKGEIIKNYFGDNYKNIEISYFFEKELLGTGGAIKNASKSLDFEKLLVLNGDTYHDISRKKFLKNINIKFNQILCQEISNPERYGIINIDKNNYVTRFEEKKELKGNFFINAGTYLINSKDIELYHEDKFSLEQQFMPSLIKKNNLKAYNLNGIFIDIGIPEDLEKAKRLFL